MPSVGDGSKGKDVSSLWARQRHSLVQKIEIAKEKEDDDKVIQYAYHLKKFGKRSNNRK